MAETLGDDLVKNITTSNYTIFVMRPDRLATDVSEAADWLAGMVAVSNGGSAEKLKEEIIKLMHSVDVVTATSDIQKEYAVSSLVIKQVAAQTEE
jgi:F420-0:gamma-glutamyl ligase-like protein